MAENGNGRSPEARLLLRLRLIAALTVGALLVFTVVVDTLGRLFISASYHVDEVLIGSLIGAFLLITATAAVTSIKLPGGWEIRRPVLPGTEQKPPDPAVRPEDKGS